MASSKLKDFMAVELATDSDLIKRAGQGNLEAFNALVRKWEKPLYNFALRLTGQREDALDLAQDAFLKAYRQLHQLQSRDKFSHWLFKIALNLFYSSKRGSRDGQTVSLEEEIGDGLTLNDTLVSEQATSAKNSDALIIEREQAREVRSAILKLSSEQRAAIVLKVYYGMKFEEIAAIVDCPVSTVKSRVYAAMENLQKTLCDGVA